MAERVALELAQGKVGEFARAVHTDDGCPSVTGGGSRVVPATFLTVMNFLEDAETIAGELGFDLRRMLHAEQEYTFTGSPPTAGTWLWATSRVERRYEKQGRRGRLRFAVRVTEFTDAGGSLVATARMTAVETPDQDGQ